MDSAAIPALSIAVIKKGKLIWAKTLGVRNRETKQPADKNSIFEAASLGKPVIAFAVLKLCDSNKMELDTPLVRYIPLKILEKQFLKHL
jgi:CubicO group peptidase (beta-lactamase class C family)